MNTIGKNVSYNYGPDQSRYKGIWKNNGTQYRKRIYASGYEINEETVNGVTTTQNISYVSSPGGLCAMYVEENGSGTFYFVHTDHLGSITAVTNANGNVIARQNFDAWGRRRKVQDYSYLPQNTSSTDNGLNNNGTLPQWLYRGYTGHEHLDEFALINMNARLYDPVVGMFLSPDNYIQAPGNTQNYNRYAYCLNNPLKYTDPSGNRFEGNDLVYIAFGAAFGAASWSPLMQHRQGKITTGQAFGLYVVNAAAFIAGAGIGSAVSSSIGTIGGATAGGLASGAVSGGGGYMVMNSRAGVYYGNDNDLWTSTWQSSLAGGAGGAANGILGGGSLGSFAGGFTSSSVGNFLGSGRININEACISGGISLGMYAVSTTANWRTNSDNLSLGGYFLRQELVSLSHSWQLEASWYEMKNGSIKGMKIGSPFGNGIDPAPKPSGEIALEAHTHVRFGTGNEYFGPTDMSRIPVDAKTSGHGYKVYGWKNSYTLSNDQAAKMPLSMKASFYITPQNYNNTYAYPNGLPSLACPLGFSYYHNVLQFK